MSTHSLERPESFAPAFVSHQKALASRSSKSSGDCCYSICNLCLIVAGVVAIVFTCKFLQTDPLYEYVEHILSLRFYRQVLYIMVVLPLVLVISVFNSVRAFCSSAVDEHSDLGVAVTTMRLVYQAVMVVLLFVALTFMLPHIRFASVSTQIDVELRRHMKRRYDNDFSFQFLDVIQETYECCDELWYRANLFDKVPLSCYAHNGRYDSVFTWTCADVLGSLVSTRCAAISAAIASMMLALVVLIALDVSTLWRLNRQDRAARVYDVGAHESRLLDDASNAHPKSDWRPRRPSAADNNDDNNNNDDDDDQFQPHQSQQPQQQTFGQNRARPQERQLESPLLWTRRQQQQQTDDEREVVAPTGRQPERILTRAAYLPAATARRAQSPVIVGNDDGPPTPTGSQASARGVLKKSSSFSRNDDYDEDDDEDDARRQQVRHLGDDAQRQQVVQRDLPSRRSLLSVRFAE